MGITIEDVIKSVKKYNPDAVPMVHKAYELAAKAHINQKRESGEPYIIHPLHVCLNLTKFNADEASLCAGLLHDVVEDTEYDLDYIKKEFNSDIARLVDGVTKISNLHFPSKDEATNANIRRIINSLNDDVRIIIIKLCDRWHNMETLQYKEPHKQIRCAEETLNIFVPLAYFIGAFRLKCDLEDMCLSYLEPETYQSLKVKQEEILKDYEKCLKEAEKDVCNLLHQHHIKHTIRAKIMNVYQIYKKINKGYRINDIHDLVNIKIMVNKKEDCYKALGLIHELYTPLNQKFKDYIACPKTNMYRSVHTTVFGPDNHLIQFQIKTHQMDQINTIGLAAYWEEFKEEASGKMQHDLKMNYQFFTSLQDINAYVQSDSEYIARVREEIFTNTIYVYSLSGEVVELPNDSTVLDYAYKIHTNLGNRTYAAFVNGNQVELDYRLNNKDRVLIIPNDDINPTEEWLKYVVTSNAIRKIKDYLKEHNNVN